MKPVKQHSNNAGFTVISAQQSHLKTTIIYLIKITITPIIKNNYLRDNDNNLAYRQQL